jgi:hypothetical protein
MGPIKPNGYGQFSIGKQSIMAHRAALQLYKPNDSGEVAMHKCHNKWCANPDHIEYGTQKQNWHASNKLGVTYRGAGHHLTSLNEATVKEIRNTSGTASEVAKQFNTSVHVIYSIRQGRTWKHV